MNWQDLQMAYSGLVKDTDNGLIARGKFPLTLVIFTALAAALGWAFYLYVPQFVELEWRISLGLAMTIALVLMTMNISAVAGERMFGAVCMGAAFAVGMWGPWAHTLFGGLPTLDQIQAQATNTTYTLQSFGEPFTFNTYVFEMWVAITAVFAGLPLLVSFAKSGTAADAKNPFNVHADFADAFMPRFIFLPLISFAIAGGAVYAYPYLRAYDIPLEAAWLPPLIAAFFYTKMHMTFPKALFISIIGGIAGAAGFWVPWLYMKFGQVETIAFFQGTHMDIKVRALELSSGYSYTSEIGGTTLDYSPWTFEIWVGLTLSYLLLPVFLTILRRLFYLIRAS